MKDILQYLGLFFILVFSFLGADYLFSGEIILSGVVSVVLVIIMFSLVNFMIRRKNEISKNKYSTVSIILFSLFVLCTIPVAFLSFHALNVEINAKREAIEYANQITEKNQAIINLFKSNYTSYLNDVDVRFKKAAEDYLNSKDGKQKEFNKEILLNKPFSLNVETIKELTPSTYTIQAQALFSAKEIKFQQTIDSVEKRTKTVIDKNLHLVQNWSRLRVPSALKQLDNLPLQNLTQLNNSSLKEHEKNISFLKWDEAAMAKTNELGITSNESNQLSFKQNEIILSDFMLLFSRYNPFLIFIPVLLLIFLLILPYLLEHRGGVYIENSSKQTPNDEGIEI